MTFGPLKTKHIDKFNEPFTLYISPAEGAIVDILIINHDGVPHECDIAVSSVIGEIPETDYIAIDRPIKPSISPDSFSLEFRKILMEPNATITLILRQADASQDMVEDIVPNIVVRVQGVDGADLTVPRYGF